MKKLCRRLAFLVAMLLWIPVLALALEWGARLQWKWIERSNPYVLACKGVQPWPDPQVNDFTPAASDSDDAATPAPARRDQDPPASMTPPEEYRRSHEPWRRAIFAALNDEERGMCAQQFNEHVVVFQRDGMVMSCYGSPPPEALTAGPGAKSAGEAFPMEGAANGSESGTQLVERVFRTGVSEQSEVAWQTKKGPVFFTTSFFPLRDATDAIGAVAAAIERPFGPWPPGSYWVMPFFVVKDNVGKSASILKGAESFMNNKGFRDADVVLPKPQDVCRIVCIGASTTFEGTTNETTYPNLLERVLNAQFPGKKIDVVNCGIVGITSLGEWFRFQDYLDLEPDLIVYYDGVNDLCHWLFQNWVFDAERWQKCLRQSCFVQRYFNRWLLPSAGEMTKKIEQKVFKSLRAMADAAQQHHVPMAFCSFAYPDIAHLSRAERKYYEFNTRQDWGGIYVTFDSYCRAMALFNERIRALCNNTGSLYVPVAENIRGGGKYFGDICHMKDDGIALKAQVIAQGLTDFLKPRLNLSDTQIKGTVYDPQPGP